MSNETPQPNPKGRLAALIGIPAAAALMSTIALWEGYEPEAYKDVVGITTACWGDTQNVEMGKRYTRAECEARLERQALAHVEPVLRCTPRIKGSQLIAAGSLTYNIGPAAYCRSTVAKRFNAGRLREGCEAFLMWDRAGGKRIRGLTNRRRYEREVCLRGL